MQHYNLLDRLRKLVLVGWAAMLFAFGIEAFEGVALAGYNQFCPVGSTNACPATTLGCALTTAGAQYPDCTGTSGTCTAGGNGTTCAGTKAGAACSTKSGCN